MALENGIKFTSIGEKFRKCQHLTQEFSQRFEQPTNSRQLKQNARSSAKIINDKENDGLECTTSGEKNVEEDSEARDLKEQYFLSMSQSKVNPNQDNKSSDFFFEPFEEVLVHVQFLYFTFTESFTDGEHGCYTAY